MTAIRRVAVLGGGIMGSCAALFLARRGIDVTLFEAQPALMDGASRWNEGKIHLGYLYGADLSLATCRMVLPGGLRFVPLVEELTGVSAADNLTQDDDIFLYHEDSVVGIEDHRRCLDAVSALVREHPDAASYPGDARSADARALTPSELESFACGDRIRAGYRVPERSMNTRWLADRLVEALEADPRVEIRTCTRVASVSPEGDSTDRWRVISAAGEDRGFDAVINALWNGRLPVDLSAGLPIGPVWSHRYRVAAFLRSSVPVSVRSTLVCVGAFGDVKNFGGHDFYVSWYPAGLRLDSADLDPPAPAALTAAGEAAMIDAIRTGIGEHVPGIDALFRTADDIRIAGGFVFAEGGAGRIDERSSTLHARDRFGVRRKGTYFSVDTGKWSTAPWMASRLVAEIAGETPEP
jgi:glycine/D-amino acid oxidase-like deaminating enzyme